MRLTEVYATTVAMFGAPKGHAPNSAACPASGNPLPQVQQGAAGAPTQQRHCAATPFATASSRIGTSSYEVGHPLRLKPSSANSVLLLYFIYVSAFEFGQAEGVQTM